MTLLVCISGNLIVVSKARESVERSIYDSTEESCRVSSKDVSSFSMNVSSFLTEVLEGIRCVTSRRDGTVTSERNVTRI